MMTVPFNDLARAYRAQADELERAVQQTLASGWYVHGPEHERFEEAFAAFVGTERCIGVASGTDALTIALRAVTNGAAQGRVITAANAGGYAAAAARLNDLSLVYADVDPHTLCLTAEGVEDVLDEDVVAVVVTHLYGRMAPVDEIVTLCRAHRVPVVEDCAQSAGASRDGRAAGSVGDIATFSFYPTKNLGAVGDGGAIVTSDGDLADTVQQLRQYGWRDKYRAACSGGTNSRLDEIQAAVLNVRLPHVRRGNARRREIIGHYVGAAAEVEGLDVLPADDESHAGHLAVALADDRPRVRRILTEKGIGTDVHYPVPDHHQPIAADPRPTLPVTERAASHVLSLPCFPEMRDDEIDHVCAIIRSL